MFLGQRDMMMTWQKWRRMQASLRVHLKNLSLPQQPMYTSPPCHSRPSDSWMAQIYGPQYPNLLSVTSGRRASWDETATTSDGHDNLVLSVAFFPDGRKLASGSADETVRVWVPGPAKQILHLSLDILLMCGVLQFRRMESSSRRARMTTLCGSGTATRVPVHSGP